MPRRFLCPRRSHSSSVSVPHTSSYDLVLCSSLPYLPTINYTRTLYSVLRTNSLYSVLPPLLQKRGRAGVTLARDSDTRRGYTPDTLLCPSRGPRDSGGATRCALCRKYPKSTAESLIEKLFPSPSRRLAPMCQFC
jgi:hypothetical protein